MASIQSTFLTAIVDQFFEHQKEDARLYLRSEMDMVVDNLFRQLKIKFNCMVIGNTTNANNCNSLFSTPQLISQQRQQLQSNLNGHTNGLSTISQQNGLLLDILQRPILNPTSALENCNVDASIVKEEIVDDDVQVLDHTSNSLNPAVRVYVNQKPKSQENSILAQQLSSGSSMLIPSTSSSNSNLILQESQNDHTQAIDLDSEAECDCAECRNLSIKDETEEVEILEDDDSDDSIQFIENLGVIQPKRIKLEVDDNLSQSQELPPAHLEPKEALYDIGEEEEHSLEEQGGGVVETVAVNCQVDPCQAVFANRTEMEKHLLHGHGVWPLKCLQRGCTSSFANPFQLKSHLRMEHSDVTQWQCPFCPQKTYNQYKRLFFHYRNSHYRGQYKCLHQDCSHTAQYRSEIFAHYRQQHASRSQVFTCQFKDCGKTYTLKGNLRRHERTHLGIKPYVCKWPGCDYASERSCPTLCHIRQKHLKLAARRGAELADGAEPDPRAYLEVRKQLLYR